MFCKNCGKEINDNAVICPVCGVATDKFAENTVASQKTTNGMAVAGFICSFFIPLLGWIFCGIGLQRAAQIKGKGKGLSIAGIIIATLMFILNFCLLFA